VGNQFPGEPHPLDITVTAQVIGKQGGIMILHAIVEDGTAADGGDFEVHISGSAMSAYGIDACIAELESVLNSTLRPEYRLSAALAMGAQGAFLIVTSNGAGLRVVIPSAGQRAA